MQNVKIDLLTQVGYKILQNEKRFCFGIDAVLLADFSAKKVRANSNVIDLCSGNGIIALLVCGITKARKITAMEIQKEDALLAKESVKINMLDEKINIINDDLKKVSLLFEKYSFDTVICNPPYIKSSHGKENSINAKTIARREIFCELEDIIKSVEYLLKPNGHFFMIHRPERLSEIFVLLNKYKLEASEIRFVQPFVDKVPTMVLVEARKNITPNLKVDIPLIIYSKRGVYSDEVKSIYSCRKFNSC